ncbi:MAG: hypothetical protein V1874_13285 [Spirochaetota bacterium]
MKQLKIKRLLFSIIAILAFPVFFNCAVYPGKQLHTVNQFADKSAFTKKPSVYLDIKIRRYADFKIAYDEESLQLIEIIEKTTKESQMFSKYTTDQTRNKQMDYSIMIKMYRHPHISAGVITSMTLCILTLGIIPMRMQNDYYITATLNDSKGNELKSYQYYDYTSLWGGIFVLPAFVGPEADWGTWFSVENERVHFNTLRNMIRNLYTDIEKDKLLLDAH